LKEDFAMRNALGYVRVSTDEQAERGLGLEAQRQRIQAYCEMKGLRLTTMFEDPGLSGGKPLGSRSAGGRLLAEARRTKPVVVAMVKEAALAWLRGEFGLSWTGRLQRGINSPSVSAPARSSAARPANSEVRHCGVKGPHFAKSHHLSWVGLHHR
jgi:hypothetical protein